MRKSELRQIIREEIKRTQRLNETTLPSDMMTTSEYRAAIAKVASQIAKDLKTNARQVINSYFVYKNMPDATKDVRKVSRSYEDAKEWAEFNIGKSYGISKGEDVCSSIVDYGRDLWEMPKLW
jgi:hypothetical protein